MHCSTTPPTMISVKYKVEAPSFQQSQQKLKNHNRESKIHGRAVVYDCITGVPNKVATRCN